MRENISDGAQNQEIFINQPEGKAVFPGSTVAAVMHRSYAEGHSLQVDLQAVFSSSFFSQQSAIDTKYLIPHASHLTSHISHLIS
jgi:hypothetical protein